MSGNAPPPAMEGEEDDYGKLLSLSTAELMSGRYDGALARLRQRILEEQKGNKAIAKAGWMLKRKQKGKKMSGWKKRFVVVDSDSISYFAKPGEAALGTWELIMCQARAEEERGKAYVVLYTPEASYGLQCEEGQPAAWLEAINEARRALFLGRDEASGNGPPKDGLGKMRKGSRISSKMGKLTGAGGRGPSQGSTLGASYLPTEVEEGDSAQRVAALAELIATEEVYVHNLGVVVRHWMPALLEAAGQESQAVFGNVQLLESVNSQLLGRLRRPESRRTVGEAFLGMVPFFKMYKDYCANQDDANRRLEELRKKKKAVREALERVQQQVPAVNGMTLESYLIMPMQRICRYPLVLGEILKHTPCEWDDVAQLKAAIEAVSTTTKEVNEVKRQTEQQRRTLEIQTELEKHNKDIGSSLLAASRRLIGESRLQKAVVFGDEIEAALVYLFSDVVLVCVRDKKRLLLLHRVALGALCEVQKLPFGLEEPNGFAIKHGSGRIELFFEEGDVAGSQWKEQLETALLSSRDLAGRQGRPVSPRPSGAPKGPSRRVSTTVIQSSSKAVPITSGGTAADPRLMPRSLQRANTMGTWRRGTIGGSSASPPAASFSPPVRRAPSSPVAAPQQENSSDDSDEVVLWGTPRDRPPAKPLPVPPPHPDDDDGSEEVIAW